MTWAGLRQWGLAQARALGGLALGCHADTRELMRLMLQVVVMQGVCVVGLQLNLLLGFGHREATMALTLVIAVTSLVFVVLLRSGISRRWSDPGLVMPQAVASLTTLAAAYLVVGETRGIALTVAMLPPVFASNALGGRAMWRLCLYGVVVFALPMGVATALDPVRFPPTIELLNLMTLSICMAAMGMVLSLVDRWRLRLARQRDQLRQAMAAIERVSATDELTQLPNRRHLVHLLAEAARARAEGGPAYCVAVIDIDHFKRLNDAHGHAQGDLALRRFAALARAALAPGQVLGRWGGEEFLLWLPDTTASTAVTVLSGMRHKVAAAAAWADHPHLRVSFSAGLATDAGQRPEAIVARADRALYRAKALGRDRLMLDDPAASDPAHATVPMRRTDDEPPSAGPPSPPSPPRPVDVPAPPDPSCQSGPASRPGGG